MNLEGTYWNPDDAYHDGCEPGEWPGFEGWDEPIPIFSDTESDTPTHCKTCEGLIAHALTADGYEYVRQAVAEAIQGLGRRCIVKQWAEFYTDALDFSDWPDRDEFSPITEGSTK